MQLKLGDKIKELRKEKNCTQEKLAHVLGVTAQAVSKWESNFCYPDIEFMPTIANYFGITIDELFGYDFARNKKIENILNNIERRESEWASSAETLELIERAAEEFPNNEWVILKLAIILEYHGWQTHNENIIIGNDGYYINEINHNSQCPEWIRAIGILEELRRTSTNSNIIDEVSVHLVRLYRVTGEYEKAKQIAEIRPSMDSSCDVLMAEATDNVENAKYRGKLLMKLADAFTENMMTQITRNIKLHEQPSMMIEKIKGLINIHKLLCEDDISLYNVSDLYLYLSTWYWRAGMKDEAFAALDTALCNAKARDEMYNGDKRNYNSYVLSECTLSGWQYKLAPTLPGTFPQWMLPEHDDVKAEMQADLRWDLWVNKTKE